MRWAAMAILISILITGCRKHEKDVEALSREAVEDEVTAVLDSLEQASNVTPPRYDAGRQDLPRRRPSAGYRLGSHE